MESEMGSVDQTAQIIQIIKSLQYKKTKNLSICDKKVLNTHCKNTN